MDFRERPLAIVDLETSGDDELAHEILEIGLVVVRQDDLRVRDSGNWLVKPHHIGNAIPAALERNGYNEKDWQDARELAEVMPIFAKKTDGAIFTAFNVSFDWAFVKQAFRATRVPNLMDYHRLDVLSLAWFAGGKRIPRLNLREVAKFFGVSPEPDPHRAMHGAETALEVLRKIKEKNSHP